MSSKEFALLNIKFKVMGFECFEYSLDMFDMFFIGFGVNKNSFNYREIKKTGT